uniref:Uncharacterized protein n=1 Tax=Arundo donax TaxID=35708 RepID=A0A0A9H3V8_ARUDO
MGAHDDLMGDHLPIMCLYFDSGDI